MRVLYIYGVGAFGGASRSLYEAVKGFEPNSVDAFFIAAQGTASNFYKEISVDLLEASGLSRFDNTLYSHYRGKRWLILGREIAYLPSTLSVIRAAKKRWSSVDVIHVNEILEIVPAILAKLHFNAPLIVHVRSVQRKSDTLRYRTICRLLRKYADRVIAIDENVRHSLPADIQVDVIHNSFTSKVAPAPDLEMIGRLDALRSSSLKVGFVGNLHHSKGLFEMLEAAKILKSDSVDVEFAIVGGTTISDSGFKAYMLNKIGLAQNVASEVAQRASDLGVADMFHLLGPTHDIQSVYERIDVICFASHYDAPGRPIFEAAFAGVPCVTAIREPRSDTVVHSQTGLAIPPRDATALARAITHFASDRSEVARMGKNAKKLATENFDPQKNSQLLLATYRKLIQRKSKHRD